MYELEWFVLSSARFGNVRYVCGVDRFHLRLAPNQGGRCRVLAGLWPAARSPSTVTVTYKYRVVMSRWILGDGAVRRGTNVRVSSSCLRRQAASLLMIRSLLTRGIFHAFDCLAFAWKGLLGDDEDATASYLAVEPQARLQ